MLSLMNCIRVRDCFILLVFCKNSIALSSISSKSSAKCIPSRTHTRKRVKKHDKNDEKCTFY